FQPVRLHVAEFVRIRSQRSSTLRILTNSATDSNSHEFGYQGGPMFFRFGTALVLAVLISLAGTALEKRNLALKRAVSRQHSRLEILLEQHASNRVLAQQLGAPARLVDELGAAAAAEPAEPEQPTKPKQSRGRHLRARSHARSGRST